MHIQYYLSGNCFGDHFTRAGIDLRDLQRSADRADDPRHRS